MEKLTENTDLKKEKRQICRRRSLKAPQRATWQVPGTGEGGQPGRRPGQPCVSLGLCGLAGAEHTAGGAQHLPLTGHPQTHSPLLPSLCPTTLGSKQRMTPSELQGREGLCHQMVEGLLWGVTVVVGRGTLLVPGIAGRGSRSTV